ncbi:MAG TPA: response regulator, partial [Turneriella sp.]|nr:response regulator [Turneriella sp.]
MTDQTLPEKKKILIVEDEDVQLIALETFLSQWGFTIIAVKTATAAIAWLSQNEPDMALIDLHLPDNPGIEILKHIRDTDGSIPVPVFTMSAEDSPEIRIVCMSTGADDFLPKPLNFADVSMKIQQAFERVSYKKEIQKLNAKLEKDKKSLQRYFSADLVEEILNEEFSTELGGQIVSASIMFFDIRGSTT